MAELDNIMGMSGMVWFIGTVEDRGSGQFSGKKDNLKIGRIKVRIKGLHTENKSDLQTAELPWCQVLMPTTSASISGVGHSPTGIVENSKVIGFFLDGHAHQQPVVFGVLPHIQQKEDADQNSVGSGSSTYAFGA